MDKIRMIPARRDPGGKTLMLSSFWLI